MLTFYSDPNLTHATLLTVRVPEITHEKFNCKPRKMHLKIDFDFFSRMPSIFASLAVDLWSTNQTRLCKASYHGSCGDDTRWDSISDSWWIVAYIVCITYDINVCCMCFPSSSWSEFPVSLRLYHVLKLSAINWRERGICNKSSKKPSKQDQKTGHSTQNHSTFWRHYWNFCLKCLVLLKVKGFFSRQEFFQEPYLSPSLFSTGDSICQ